MHTNMAVKIRRAPGRIAAGGFILNSGLTKLRADDATAKTLHDMASGAYPVLSKVDPKRFTRALAVTEVTLGGALLLPIVPAAAAGAGLAAFSGGLLGMYWRTPGMHPDGDPRPKPNGIPVAKDLWLAGIAAGLIADSIVPDWQARRALRRADRRAAKAEAKMRAAQTKLDRIAPSHQTRRELGRYAREHAKASRAHAKALEKSASAQLKTAGASTLGAARSATHNTIDAAKSAASSAHEALV